MILGLLDPRVWLFVAAVGAAGYLKGCHDGQQGERDAQAVSTAHANEEARRLERARQSRADDAARLAATREAGIRAAAAGARRESDGLRDDLRAANDYAKESRAAAERVAAVATELLEQCTASYLGVAEAADRADSEARQLRQAWPK